MLDVASHHSGWSLNRPPCVKKSESESFIRLQSIQLPHVSLIFETLEIHKSFCMAFSAGEFLDVAYDSKPIYIYKYTYVYIPV